MDVIELMKKEMLRRKYGSRTIKTYVYCLRKFMSKCHKEPKKINREDVIDYLDRLSQKDLSGSTININLQALKFMMEEVLHRSRSFYHIKYSKTPKKLPEVLSKDETIKLIKTITNNKHQLMIKLMYSAGLRVSELVHLKVKDFEFEINHGWVRKGKGNKDRLFIIAKKIKKELQDYIQKEGITLDSWLFSSYNGHISQRTAQVIVKKTAKEAKISKNVYCHTLRHSYATHLIENGYDVASVQSLLGHNSPETTMIYLRMASPKMINVVSPLDNLNFNNLQLDRRDEKLGYENENFNTTGLKNEEFT